MKSASVLYEKVPTVNEIMINVLNLCSLLYIKLFPFIHKSRNSSSQTVSRQSGKSPQTSRSYFSHYNGLDYHQPVGLVMIFVIGKCSGGPFICVFFGAYVCRHRMR